MDVKNVFIRGVMNKDLDDRLVPEGQYRDAQNISVSTSDGDGVGAAKNHLGNTLRVDIATLSGRQVANARTIGSVAYEAGNLIYWMVASDYFDGIYEYNNDTGIAVRVLQSNRTPLTISKLNFNQQYPITGINYIVGPNGNNFLYWTDDFNPPRRINITRVKSGPLGIGGYAIDDARIDDDIDVILEPPMYAPSIRPFTDSSDVLADNMSEKFLYFAYRWMYDDNQYSSLSPFSAVSFLPKEYEFDYGVGNNKSMTNLFNACEISFETGNRFVKAVQVVVRDTRNINVGIVETFDKEDLGWNLTSNESRTTTFKNNKVLSSLPSDQVTRLFDNVPLLAKAQEVIGNRLSYGNYVQFRDIVDCNGSQIKVDFELSLKNNDELDIPSTSNPLSTWKSGMDYEVALLYSDKYGRLTTALTCEDNSIHVPLTKSSDANVITLKIRNNPPCWATHYRIALKQSRGKYYNIFPILFYADGVYRYLLINDSDKDKFAVGDYITVKSTLFTGGPSVKKYKILEFEAKGSNFISVGSVTEIPGLYIKIKVDDPSEFGSNTQTIISNQKKSSNYTQGLPVYSRLRVSERAIHYGLGDPNALQVLNTQIGPSSGSSIQNYGFDRDTRTTIEILEGNQYRYTIDPSKTQGWVGPLPITSGDIDIMFTLGNSTAIAFKININASQVTVGDRWIVNSRGDGHLEGNYYGGVGLPAFEGYSAGDYGGGCIVTADVVTTADLPINTGAVVRFTCIQDSLGSPYTTPQQFISPANYINIEEWFNESGAWSQFIAYNTTSQNVGSQAVTFRRGQNYAMTNYNNESFNFQYIFQAQPFIDDSPVHMIIQGFGYDNADINAIEYKLEIIQSNEAIVLETVPKESDVEIYHELSQTYPIENNLHKVRWDYDDFEYDDQFGAPYTRVRQFDKTRPHYFNVGDSVYVYSSNDLNFPSNDYTVIGTPDRYTVVLDTPWVGAGPETPGFVVLSGSNNFDQSGPTTPAIIELNTPSSINSDFNSWTWGNGVESQRILDDFNQTTLEYSPRATTVIDNYKQIRNDASICYSGIYNENTQYNRLNEFNLSISNFKYLDREFGSIQRMHARDTDLLVLQESKVSSVLYGKNALTDAVGGGQIVSIPEVFGTQTTISGEFGISRNPESFAQWSDSVFFADARRGVVLSLTGNQFIIISEAGMKDYFRDIMRDNPFTQKIGCYDPHNHTFVLSFNDQRTVPCDLELSRDLLVVPSNSAGYFLFGINSDINWTITIQDTGDGVNWVSDFPTAGNGSQTITGSVSQNTSFSTRSVNFVVSYCNGQTEIFTLVQARGRKGKIVLAVFNTKKR
jgi:hypothetical protein